MEVMAENYWKYTHRGLTPVEDTNAVIRVAKNLNQKPASVPVNNIKPGVGGKGTTDDTKPKLEKHKINICGTIVDGYDTFDHIPQEAVRVANKERMRKRQKEEKEQN